MRPLSHDISDCQLVNSPTGQDMELSQEAGSVTPILESTEIDGAQIKLEVSPVKDEQWRAMKTIIDILYNHREPE